jgi:hypothetical protein
LLTSWWLRVVGAVVHLMQPETVVVEVLVDIENLLGSL